MGHVVRNKGTKQPRRLGPLGGHVLGSHPKVQSKRVSNFGQVVHTTTSTEEPMVQQGSPTSVGPVLRPLPNTLTIDVTKMNIGKGME